MTPETDTGYIAVIGGGLAGCECAWQLARFGRRVRLFEMRPQRMTPAHAGGHLAELVCSNSLRSAEPSTGIGLLKQEMTALDSVIMAAAHAARVPAGKALAVDRELFSAGVEAALAAQPRISIERREIAGLDDPALAGAEAIVVAAGPLASEPLAEDLARTIGAEGLYFYDAIAPIVDAASIDMSRAFFASRWTEGESDYLNCPLNEDEYHALVAALREGEKVPAREFEKAVHFEGCLPVEELAERGEMTLAFGPLKPVGLVDPATGERPFAVVQLRAENAQRTAYNLVGFQTKLTYPEQRRVFRMIPALHQAEFLRLGQVHRNTYVDAPKVLGEDLALLARPGVYLAGQITGVEGYLESAACGLWLGLALGGSGNIPRPPATTALGGLLHHLRTPVKRFQPSNVHFGLLPELGRRAPKRMRKELYAQRAQQDFAAWRAGLTLPPAPELPGALSDEAGSV